MLSRDLLKIVVASLVILVATPTVASANRVIDDAQDGLVNCSHSIGALRGAQGELSPEEAEYSDIDETISTAIAKKQGGACSNKPVLGVPGRVIDTKTRANGTTVKRLDTDGDGKADREVEQSSSGAILKNRVLREIGSGDSDDEQFDDDDTTISAAGEDTGGGSSGGGSWWPLFVLLIIGAFGGLAFWRLRRKRRRAALDG